MYIMKFLPFLTIKTIVFGVVWPGLGGSVVVDLLFIVTPIVGVCNCSMFCCSFLNVPSSFSIILMGKRESWLLC